MPRVRVLSFAMSLDGYSAGPHQDVDHPLGVNGPELFDWFFQTRVWREMHGLEARLVDDVHIALRPVLLGAGENLFAGMNARALGYELDRRVTGERATHVFLRRRS